MTLLIDWMIFCEITVVAGGMYWERIWFEGNQVITKEKTIGIPLCFSCRNKMKHHYASYSVLYILYVSFN